MINRWVILFVLFFARTVMAFQYQSVAALSPFVAESLALSVADLGILIGLYLGPGVLVAIPGGTFAARFGDKRVVGVSLGVMLAGSVLSWLATTWEVAVLGRVLAGVGGVVINVVMTKLLVDWFQGREIGTAMGVFIASWPAGIALALLILPTMAELGGLAVAWVFVMGVVAVALVLFVVIYRVPPGAADGPSEVQAAAFPVYALAMAAGIWAFYNAALAMVFAFGPLMLGERGIDIVTASAITSVFIAGVGIAVPVGGIVSDWSGRRDLVIGVSLVGGIIALLAGLVVPTGALTGVFALGGFVFGLGAGLIMTLPGQVLAPNARSFGMGVFFTVYYALMMVAPAIAGGMAERSGDAGIAFVLGAAMMGICLVGLLLFRRAAARLSM
ncbi:MAG: MFS transporter [Boseongicola sp.]|nr:MFS transporter [Boseongicola sp.]